MKSRNPHREEVRENCLTILITKDEKARIKRLAEKNGLSMSGAVRMIIFSYLNEKEEF